MLNIKREGQLVLSEEKLKILMQNFTSFIEQKFRGLKHDTKTQMEDQYETFRRSVETDFQTKIKLMKGLTASTTVTTTTSTTGTTTTTTTTRNTTTTTSNTTTTTTSS